MTPAADLTQRCVHTIRFLAADAVQQANSGHPGTPMGLADLALVLWTRFLRYNPEVPDWRGEPNGDNYYSFYAGRLDKGNDDIYCHGDWAMILGAIDLIRT